MIKTKMNPIKFLLELFNRAGIKKLLFENKGIRQTIIKNTIWLTGAEALTSLLGLFLVIGIARILGVSEYGKFAFALSFVSLFAIFSDLGVSEIGIRELSKSKDNEKEYPAFISLKIILALLAFAVMVLISFFITKDLIVRKAIWILALFIAISVFFDIIIVFLRARQKMEYEALAKTFQSLIIAVFVFFTLFSFPSVKNLTFAYLLANLFVLGISLFIFHFFIHPLKLNYDKVIWKKFLKSSWPLTFGLSLIWIYSYIDSIMLGQFGLIKETGWFNAASKITIATVMPAILVAKSFYPALSRIFFWAKEFLNKEKNALQTIWNYYMEIIIVLAVPIIAGGWVLSSEIIELFYGVDYQPAGFVFKLLLVVVGISFFYYPHGLVLVVANQQRKNFFLIAAGALINIILNFILIKKYSVSGAVLATIIASFAVFLAAIYFSRRFAFIKVFNFQLFKTLIFSFSATLLMVLIIKGILAGGWHIVLAILSGGFVYCAFLFLFYRIAFNLKLWKF